MSQANSLRDTVVSHIVSKLDLKSAYAKDLEIGIFNWCIKYSNKSNIAQNWNDDRFQNIYKTKALSIISNLDKNSYVKNENLIEKLKTNKIVPHEIPFMNNKELFPEIWQALHDEKIRKDKLMIAQDDGGAKTDQFRCGKCKSKNCSYYEMQTRSADESTTIFVTCLDCSNRWRC